MNWALLAGSVAGVLGLAAIAWMLGLGGGTIADAEEAKRIAADSLSGFDPVEAIVSQNGAAALVEGQDGTVALLKAHGVHVAARRLARPVPIEVTPSGVRIASGERMFGDVALVLSPEDRDKLLTMV